MEESQMETGRPIRSLDSSPRAGPGAGGGEGEEPMDLKENLTLGLGGSDAAVKQRASRRLTSG